MEGAIGRVGLLGRVGAAASLAVAEAVSPVGVSPVAADGCQNVNTSTHGTLTAERVPGDGATISGNVDALGCDIGVYVNDGLSVTIDGANIHDATRYGVYNDGEVDVFDANIHNIGHHNGAGDFSPNGGQYGVGVYFDGNANPASGEVRGSEVHDYQKGGIVVNGDHANGVIVDNEVTGLGAVDFIAQNGIQFGYEAEGVARGNLIDGGHEYTGNNWTATGLLLFDVDAKEVKTSNNQFRHNQRNRVLVEDTACPNVHGGVYEDYGLC